MASKPPDLPESIVLGAFQGVRNTVTRERLGPSDLEAAVNVDIDDTGQASRRRGFAQVDDSDYHSIRTIGNRVYGVKDGALGIIQPDYSFVDLGASVGAEPVSYAQVATAIYFSSQTASGKIVDGGVEPWGMASDAGEWVSPVMTPTDTLGEVFGVQINAPPLAQEIAYYSSRIYLAAGRYLWATLMWQYDYIERTRNFLQFESEITMLYGAGDGLYVGTTDGVYFLKGTLSEGFRMDKLQDGAVLRGSAVEMPAAEVHPSARQGPYAESTAVVFITEQGICAGFDGGQLLNLTRARVGFPAGVSSAALYRADQGASTYLAAINSGGGVAANVRIGDHVEAELIRAADRGLA